MNDSQIDTQISAAKKLFMTHQLHFWVTDADYEFISAIAAENEETIAATVRRMIRAARKTRVEKQRILGTTPVPIR